jgi:NADH-quinone oxidoreductase subunit A
VATAPVEIIAYLTLFIGVGIAFIFAALLLGRFLRPRCPTPQKAETYECGETAVGPHFLQYDLRFYVVALLFIIFEVEVALFFPPAVVFGKVNQLRVSPDSRKTLGELGVPALSLHDVPPLSVVEPPMTRLALAVIVDLGLFFAILLVGFAYLWHRGDIAWVRARPEERRAAG